MGVHEAVVGAKVGELLPIVTGHLVYQGALAVYYLVVREGQDEVLVEGVDEGERDLVVVVLAVDGILGHVLQAVVHPAHVPLVTEPQTTHRGRAADHGPGCRFLREGGGAWVLTEDELVRALQECYGLQVLVAAVHVREPLALLPGVVEVEHRGDGVDPQPVYVILGDPEQRVAEKVVAHLATTEVEDQRSPVRVAALAGV